MLWEPPRGQAPEALGELVGSRRADVLLALDQARSTAELARRLDVPNSSVSQHLRFLRRSGLVDGHRVGRMVLYMRSPLGDQLAGQSEQGGGS
jgi:DNA-binding transcriptional ArsR family regulator